MQLLHPCSADVTTEVPGLGLPLPHRAAMRIERGTATGRGPRRAIVQALRRDPWPGWRQFTCVVTHRHFVRRRTRARDLFSMVAPEGSMCPASLGSPTCTRRSLRIVTHSSRRAARMPASPRRRRCYAPATIPRNACYATGARSHRVTNASGVGSVETAGHMPRRGTARPQICARGTWSGLRTVGRP